MGKQESNGIFDDLEKPPEFKSKVEHFDLRQVEIDPLNLDKEFMELPGWLAYWNQQLADAIEATMLAKAELEREEANKTLWYRSQAEFDKKKLTVDAINAKVIDHEDVVMARQIYIERDAQRLRIKGIVDAIIAKKDMLQSLGAKLRAEMSGDLALREQMAGASAQELASRTK